MLSDLTLLGPLGPSALRRALVQPALSCGYKFEDEALVEEMVQEVVSERGALPLLAFAASRLWDARDRDRGVLTRAAYEESAASPAPWRSTRRRRSIASGRSGCRWCESCSATS